MDVLLLASVLLNGILGTIIYLKVFKQEPKKEALAVKYYEETKESVGFFKKEKSLSIKAQLIYEGVPVGQPFTVIEHRSEEIDRKQLNQTVKDLAQPLMQVGIRAILP